MLRVSIESEDENGQVPFQFTGLKESVETAKIVLEYQLANFKVVLCACMYVLHLWPDLSYLNFLWKEPYQDTCQCMCPISLFFIFFVAIGTRGSS